MNRLLQSLKMQEKSDDYTRWEERWKAMHEILLDSNEISDATVPNVKAIEELASRLNAIDRRLEAVVWKSIEAFYRKSPPEALKHWNSERQKMVAEKSGFPDQSVRLCGLSLDTYPCQIFSWIRLMGRAVLPAPQSRRVRVLLHSET